MTAQCTVISGDRCVHDCRGPVPRSYEVTSSGLCHAHNPSRLAGWLKLAVALLVALQLEQLSQSKFISNWSAPVWTPAGGHSGEVLAARDKQGM